MKWSRTGILALMSVVSIVIAAEPGAGWTADPTLVERLQKRRPDRMVDESKVPAYALPDALRFADGRVVTTQQQWRERRAEILESFRSQMFGRSPGKPQQLSFDIAEEDREASDGVATFKRVAIVSGHEGRTHRFEMLLFLPNARDTTSPPAVFLLLNNRDPQKNTDPTRRVKSDFWPVERIVTRGYATAVIQNNDLAPDVKTDDASYRQGVIRLFEGDRAERAADAWMAIAAWAWGASRAMDYLVTDPRVDAARVAVVGHSRGGKAALWAGAEDERFSMVIANESGEGGAALSRRNFGETLARITTTFPHWFNDTYRTFADRVEALPVDQHMLLALIAPRALYVASADQDLWSDPRGEFLSLAHASPVYALWGDPAIAVDGMPPLERPLIAGRRGYHVRTGIHNLTPYDWDRFADFADAVWGK